MHLSLVGGFRSSIWVRRLGKTYLELFQRRRCSWRPSIELPKPPTKPKHIFQDI